MGNSPLVPVFRAILAKVPSNGLAVNIAEWRNVGVSLRNAGREWRFLRMMQLDKTDVAILETLQA